MPAARELGVFSSIGIASRSHGRRDRHPNRDPDLTWFDDPETALSTATADVVYVSGSNDVHRALTERALERGLHVIVDKPAFLDLEAAEAMVRLARDKRCLLAEATVFPFHPQVRLVRELIGDDSEAIRATAWLCIPPLPRTDFRYDPGRGGGSLLDLGPYAAATSRLLFGETPARIRCEVLSHAGVDTSFSTLMTYAGHALTGHFGFVSAYQNRLSVVTPSLALDVDRFFTTPPDLENRIRVRDALGERILVAPAADSFAMFLGACVDAIQDDDVTTFGDTLLHDARVRHLLEQGARRQA